MCIRVLFLARTQDHPRIRGTNFFANILLNSETGSSPHTRDKYPNASESLIEEGIIPAYAGQII